MTTFHFRREISPPTRLAYCVRTLGRVHRDPRHSTAGTYHDDIMLTVFLSGRGAYLLGGQQTTVVRGMVGLVIGGQGDPGLLMASPTDPYDHLYCRFAGQEARGLAEQIVRRASGQRFFPSTRWRAVAETLMRGRSYSPLRTAPELSRPVDAVLHEALSLLAQPLEDKQTRLDARSLRTYLELHLARPVDLDETANHFAVSKGYLCRMSRRFLGTTLQQAWEQMKIDWSKVLLGEPSLSIGDVAWRVGYRDPFYFSRVFKRRTGISPRQWRQRLG